MIRLGLCILVLGATVGFLSCGGSLSGGSGGGGGGSGQGGGHGGAAGSSCGLYASCDGSSPVGGGGGGSSTGTGGAYHLHAPDQHRAGAPTCSVDRGAGGSGVGGSPVICGGTGGTMGFVCTGFNAACCLVQPAFNSYCTSDKCAADGDCAPTAQDLARGLGSISVCTCASGSGCARNGCSIGNCRVDADCGSGMYCSPSTTNCITSYQCHTPLDECADFTDCAAATPNCAFQAAIGHWRCVAPDQGVDGVCIASP